MQGVIVGHSELEHADAALGRAWGVFCPGLGYDLVQPVFRLFAQAVPPDGSGRNGELLERYYKARDALSLELQDDGGRPIRTSAIHIVDYSVEQGTPPVLDVLISEEAYWLRRNNNS